MRFRDRPLAPSSLDREIYLARPALEEALLRPLKQGRNVLLLGNAGSGKTTLMRRAAEELEAEGEQVTWVNGALAESAEDLLMMVNAALEDRGSSSIGSKEPETGNRLLRLTQALAEHQRAVIMVDGLTEPEIGFELFGRVRDELWMAGHAWLVSARPKDSAALRRPPAEAFWATAVEIPPLNQNEAHDLLRRGLSEEEWKRLKEIPLGGYPRLLIREVEGALEHGHGAREALVSDLVELANALGRSEGIALSELVNLGRPVSAHDPELLERLGWSRPYVQRIFSHLETAGLVRSIPEARGQRTGRPRKLYEPNPLAAE